MRVKPFSGSGVIEGAPFEVWGGDQRRDLLYVDDAAEAFLYAAITKEAEGLALNVGGNEPVTLTALAEHVIAANGGGKYYIREFPPERKRIDIGDFLTNDTRFRALSGWRPRFRLADGLRIHSNIIASISQVTCRATR